MKFWKPLTLAALIGFQSVGYAAVETFSATGEYNMTDFDTPEIAEQIALDFARQNAAEKAGVYLEGYSRIENFRLIEDEIKTVASSKVEVIDKNIIREILPNGWILIRANITAKVDTSELDDFIAQEQKKRQQAIQNFQEIQKMDARLKRDIDYLHAQIATLKDETRDDEFIVAQERINREFLSLQDLKSFNQKTLTGLFNTENIENAIKLNPKNYQAYMMRGGSAIMDGAIKSLAEVGKMLDNISAGNTTNTTTDMTEFYSEALGYANRAIVIAPDNARLYATRANFYKAADNKSRAIEDYNWAIELAPNDAFNYEQRAEFYKDAENYAKAIEDYTKAINLSARNAETDAAALSLFYTSRAECYTELNDYERSAADYSEAIRINPSEATNYGMRAMMYTQLEDYDRAIADYDKAIELEAKREVKFLDLTGLYTANRESLVKKRDMQRTLALKNEIDKYTALIAENPSVVNYNKRGIVYYKLGEYEKALADFSSAIELSSTNKILFSNRGDCYRNLKDYPRAIEDYTRSINIDPNYQQVYFWRAWTYNELKDYQSAVKDLEKLLELNPNYSSAAYNNLAFSYAGLGEYDRALSNCERALEIDPDNKSAEKNRKQLIEKINDVSFLIELAKTHGMAEKYTLAEQEISRVIELEPENQNALFLHGLIYFQLEEFQNALNEFNKLLELAPNHSSDAYKFRGDTNLFLEKLDEAIADYERALKLDPNNENARQILNAIREELAKND